MDLELPPAIYIVSELWEDDDYNKMEYIFFQSAHLIFSCAYIQLWHFFKFGPFIGRVFINRVSLMAHVVNNLPAIQETQVQSLSQEDPLKKGMATHSSILA